MNLNDKEKRLVIRYRKKWHFSFRLIRNALAVLCIILLMFLIPMSINNIKKIRTYQREISNAKILNDELDNSIIKSNDWDTPHKLIKAHTEIFSYLLDSLGLTPDVMGFSLSINVLPTGEEGKRKCISNIDVITNCGCNNETYDFLFLEVDPTLLKVNVRSSQIKMTLTEYKLFNNHRNSYGL